MPNGGKRVVRQNMYFISLNWAVDMSENFIWDILKQNLTNSKTNNIIFPLKHAKFSRPVTPTEIIHI